MFFANAFDVVGDTIAHAMKSEELKAVDQVIRNAQADLREHLVSTHCNDREAVPATPQQNPDERLKLRNQLESLVNMCDPNLSCPSRI